MRGRHFALGVFEPGRLGDARRLHALSPGPKLLGLAVLALAASLVWRIPPAAAGLGAGLLLLAGVLGLTVWAGFPWRTAGLWVRTALWVVGALALVRLVGSPADGDGWMLVAGQSSSVVAVMLAARLLVATTRTSDLVDTLVAAAERLRPLGAKPQTFALAVALFIRTVPVLGGVVESVSAAHAARGLKRRPRSVGVPVAMAGVASTIAMSEAMAARMLPPDEETTRPKH